MRKIPGSIVKYVISALCIYLFLQAIGSSGALMGKLVSKFPYHRQIAACLEEGLGYDISFLPQTSLSFIDSTIIILIAIMAARGVTSMVFDIFNSEKKSGIRELLLAALSAFVTILVSSLVFGGIAESMNRNFGGMIFFMLLKILIFAAVVFIFVMFIRGVVKLTEGELSLGLLGYFFLRYVMTVLSADILCVYALLSIANM